METDQFLNWGKSHDGNKILMVSINIVSFNHEIVLDFRDWDSLCQCVKFRRKFKLQQSDRNERMKAATLDRFLELILKDFLLPPV